MNPARKFSCEVDAVVVGGGIAGLWLLNLLTRRGYQALLLERDTIGGGQTLASQGMIHGGIKYALGGTLTGASEAIARMPERWRRCLAGDGELDLGGLQPLSDRYYLFAGAGTLGRLTAFFASRALRGRITRLAPEEYPRVFQEPDFDGVVYALQDLVLDAPALLARLLDGVADRVYRHDLEPDDVDLTGEQVTVRMAGGAVRARRLILTAGAGAQRLLDGLGIDAPRMQLRPLHQLLVQHDYPHPVYAHCLTGITRPEPRLTITSHRVGKRWLWYVGGQLASDGVALDSAALIEHGRRELTTCMPWIDLANAAFSTLRVDRAEPEQEQGRRPDEAFVARAGAVLVCWPTKLSLAPDLGDKVLAELPAAGGGADGDRAGGGGEHGTNLPMPRAMPGTAPWAA